VILDRKKNRKIKNVSTAGTELSHDRFGGISSDSKEEDLI
jgi:hypothetical protein